jgi:hypothetical protein
MWIGHLGFYTVLMRGTDRSTPKCGGHAAAWVGGRRHSNGSCAAQILSEPAPEPEPAPGF